MRLSLEAALSCLRNLGLEKKKCLVLIGMPVNVFQGGEGHFGNIALTEESEV